MPPTRCYFLYKKNTLPKGYLYDVANVPDNWGDFIERRIKRSLSQVEKKPSQRVIRGLPTKLLPARWCD